MCKNWALKLVAWLSEVLCYRQKSVGLFELCWCYRQYPGAHSGLTPLSQYLNREGCNFLVIQALVYHCGWILHGCLDGGENTRYTFLVMLHFSAVDKEAWYSHLTMDINVVSNSTVTLQTMNTNRLSHEAKPGSANLDG